MVKLNTRKKPDLTIIQNIYFSSNELRSALRQLDLGVDNFEFKRRWDEEVVSPPDILEVKYIAWTYDHAVDLIKQYYILQNREEEFEHHVVDATLMIRKEETRHSAESAKEFIKLYRAKVRERRLREQAEMEEE